jgi:hypothetical protein
VSQKIVCVASIRSRQICRTAPNIKGGVSAMDRLWKRTVAKSVRCEAMLNRRAVRTGFLNILRQMFIIPGGASNGLHASNTRPCPRFARLGIFVTTGVTLAFVTEHPLYAASIPLRHPRRMPREIKARQRVSQACVPCGQRKTKVRTTPPTHVPLIRATVLAKH